MADLPTLDGPRVPARSGQTRSLVVLAHGYGSNGEDLIGLVPHWREALPDTAFVSPNAPYLCPGAPGGFQWWALGGSDRAAGVKAAAPILDAFIDTELAKLGLADDRVALVGFSQGTMMSLYVGPRRERQIAGIVGFSGRLIAPALLNSEIRSRPPILLVHGTDDAMVPYASMAEAESALSDAGVAVETLTCPGVGHGIDDQGLRRGGEFLQRVLSDPS